MQRILRIALLRKRAGERAAYSLAPLFCRSFGLVSAIVRPFVDAAPANAAPVDPPAYVYAASDTRPRGPREIKLCERASTFDWLYFLAPVLLDVGTIALDSQYLKQKSPPFAPYLGGGLVGFAWGWTLGSFPMALPQCSPDWVSSAPPEGDIRSHWDLAAAFTILAAGTAAIVVGTETGPIPAKADGTPAWSQGVRSTRLFIAAGGGALGALFPYLVPPRTWSAAAELRHLRAGTTADGKGGFVSYTLLF